MSIPDLFFEKEETVSKALPALLMAVILIVGLIVWTSISYIETRRANKLQVQEELPQSGGLSVEEKQKILDELSQKSAGSTATTPEEKQKILNNLSKKPSGQPTVSAEEKQKILDALQNKPQ